MLRFECDYGEGAAPAVLELLQKTNFDQTPGYGEDEYCAAARGAAETVAEVKAELRHVKRRVLDAVAAEHGIKAHNKEGGDDAQPAEPCKLLGRRLIRRYNAFAGFTTEGKLAAHDYHTNENCEGKVNEQERKAAALTHLVGKSPDVAEAHRGADSRHDEAECASP